MPIFQKWKRKIWENFLQAYLVAIDLGILSEYMVQYAFYRPKPST